MRLTSRRWQTLIFLSIIPILAAGCVNQHLPATLKVDKTPLFLGEQTSIECIASNTTGNTHYEWSSSGGNLAGEGSLVEWNADNAGNYFIKVNIEDDSGKKGTAFTTVTVVDNHQPIIEDIVVTADHRFLKVKGPGYMAGKGQEYHIECQARDEDMDDLVYKWSSSGGNIQEEGSQVIWFSPSVDGDITITVTVSDGKEGVTTQDLLISVVRCSPCTFK